MIISEGFTFRGDLYFCFHPFPYIHNKIDMIPKTKVVSTLASMP